MGCVAITSVSATISLSQKRAGVQGLPCISRMLNAYSAKNRLRVKVEGRKTMADSILRDKSKAFAKDIVFLCRQLRESRVEGVLINQLLKSGTSVGANVHEAQHAQGTKDFISKFEIA